MRGWYIGSGECKTLAEQAIYIVRTTPSLASHPPRDRPAERISNEAFGVDTHRVVHRRQHVFWRNRSRRRVGSIFVARTVDLAAADAATGEARCLHGTPVIAAASAIEFRRAAEFAPHRDQCIVEQTVAAEVVHQRAHNPDRATAGSKPA